MTISDIGILVSKRRKLFNLTQEDLAEMASISPTSIRKIERGRANPTFETLLNLGEVLGFKVELSIPHTL